MTLCELPKCKSTEWPVSLFMPRVDSLNDKTEECKFFPRIDLCNGFWEIPLRKDHNPCTALVTSSMSTNITGTINRVLGSYVAKLRDVYSDVIIVYCRSSKENFEHLSEVIHASSGAALKVKLRKSEFFGQHVAFAIRAFNGSTNDDQTGSCLRHLSVAQAIWSSFTACVSCFGRTLSSLHKECGQNKEVPHRTHAERCTVQMERKVWKSLSRAGVQNLIGVCFVAAWFLYALWGQHQCVAVEMWSNAILAIYVITEAATTQGCRVILLHNVESSGELRDGKGSTFCLNARSLLRVLLSWKKPQTSHGSPGIDTTSCFSTAKGG